MTSSTVNSTTPTSVADLITKVMDKYDTDNDKKLSSNEFSKFLSSVLDGAAGGSSALVEQPQKQASSGAYKMMLAGFDFQKLDNPNGPGGGTVKYQAARIFQNYKPMPESLPDVVKDLRAAGINATQVSMDKIDMGDGWGPIDVIQGAYPGGGVAWQWLRE